MTDAQNPYSPPQSELEESDDDRPVVLAGKGRRFGTLIVDYVLFMLLSACIGVAVFLLFGDAGSAAIQSVPDFVLGLVIMSGYYIFFEGIWARTPGKLVFGTVVINESGTRPSLGQVVGRTLCRFIPFEAFSCLGEKGWHDRLPRTSVVLAKPPRIPSLPR